MASKQQLMIQPAFDSRIRALSNPLGGSGKGNGGNLSNPGTSLTRGFMIWDPKGGNLGYTGGPFGDGRDRLNFLYNPSEIDMYYSVANSSLQSAMEYPVPGNSNVYMAPLQQTVSFTLYYDRLYELAYGTGTNGAGTGQINDPGVIGVNADLMQLQQFTGQRANLSSVSNIDTVLGGSGATETGVDLQGVGGIMMMMPCWVFLSSAGNSVILNAKNPSSNFAAVNSQMSFYGYISDYSPTVTHFNENMIPIRCSVDIDFTMLPQTSATGEAGVLKDLGIGQSSSVGPTTNQKPGQYIPPGGGNVAPPATNIAGR